MNAAAHQLSVFEQAPPLSARGALRLSEIIGALSYALDLTEGQPQGHCLRACWIGMHIGRALGLDSPALSDLFYTLLLKDTGCSSNAARLWELYGGDELQTKHDFKLVDSQSLLQLAGFVLRHAGPDEAVRARVRRLIHLYRNGESLATELVHTRCERGADIVRRLGFGPAVSAGIFNLDEHWNGKGRPQGLCGETIPVNARIALLAQVVDVFHTVGGEAAAGTQVRRRLGYWFDPWVCDAFFSVADSKRFWSGLAPEGLEQRVMDLEPAGLAILIDDERLDSIAEAFADIIDAKSHFTYGHSQRVAHYADAVALELGLGPSRRRWLYRGALLHDIGKLGVSNAILDKPGALDAQEWEAVKRHAQFTEAILLRVRVFNELAGIAGAHHERPDGKGYPKGLTADAIALETRIITAADIFDALTAARPYRDAIPIEKAFEIMERERGNAIDGRCLNALRETAPWMASE
ncbi:MAG TPA: HD domain-containing phosphohydrolase [Steroidobacteraceae bacterium]|nr:HD domain-containing phosphohydrolase [Steroidobacteraceae bacterium]